jgi:2,4-dienoyl-CoA reductase-like NADH-dependent reductase (Old Yellow Enzyme family)/thioredoxin reductase
MTTQQANPELTHLFSPGHIGTMETKNRIVMAPINNYATEEGYVTDRQIDFFVARAHGGAGLIICQSGGALEEYRGAGRMWVWDDKFLPGLTRLATAIKAAGARVGNQVGHWGMFASEQKAVLPDLEVVGPSDVPFPPTGERPRAATQADIEHIIDGLATAAQRLQRAGFELVELHAAHGQLFDQFRSKLWNRRADKYGGSLENRARFLCETIAEMRRRLGPDYPMTVRINGSDYMPGSVSIEDSVLQAPMFEEAGASALHISASSVGTSHMRYPSYLLPEAPLQDDAAAIRQAVNIPVIAVGKIGTPAIAERLLAEGKADFVAMARAFMADPEFVVKAQEGRYDDIRYCIYCNNCTGGRQTRAPEVRARGVCCTVNPGLLREASFAITPAEQPKRVWVAGAGLAGMEAAHTLAARGHDVTLFEKDSVAGGQWHIAITQESKRGFAVLTRQLARFLERAGVQVRLNTTVDAALVAEQRPDAVVVSTGAVPRVPDIPGIDRPNVVHATDVIMDKATIGRRVVVVGGRYMGMEIADYISGLDGKEVTLATRRELGRGMQTQVFLVLFHRLLRKRVQFLQHAEAWEILDTGVYLRFRGELVFIECDTVVLAVGFQPDASLAESLQGTGVPTHVIGDAVEARDALDAIREGAEIGRAI